VIDEHGDRKWGKNTAHLGRQWLENIGKVETVAWCRFLGCGLRRGRTTP
jgi:SRSO17 transposase